MKKVAGRLRLDLAQYAALASFAQFGTADLDAATRAQLERGQRAVEVLKQNESLPQTLQQQITILFALANGHLDDIAIDKVSAFEDGLHSFMSSNHPEILQAIADSGDISEENSTALTASIKEFKDTVSF